MKGLILSGGAGTRLRPITHTQAKQLVPVANKPILFYGLEAMQQAGIRDVGLVVGATHREIEEAVGNGRRFGLKVTYIEQEAPLGLAHAVKISQSFLKKSPFVMYLGDNIIKDGINSLVEEFRVRKPNAMILLAHVKEPQRFGVAELKEEKVVRLTEKPKKPKSDLALVGVYMFDHNIFKAVKAIRPSWRNELEITDAIQYLIDKKYEVHSHIINGWWKDTGRLEDILEANRIILDSLESKIYGKIDSKSRLIGKIRIEKGAEVIKSTIRGPAVIGRKTRIINSYIGPYSSISYNVTVNNSEIEHSIILEHSTVDNLSHRLEDSLIGKNVYIGTSPLKPKAYRLMVGDNSQVGVI
ncbi:MAG: glucose-1-phosphate thymidylyltransferase [Candidatus Omnitrophica bacterium]|nr:glucose-1-phosphate thymidylyltransferase [Candidatus Omnitrophota bacterium]